jgi:hypothetical protein
VDRISLIALLFFVAAMRLLSSASEGEAVKAEPAKPLPKTSARERRGCRRAARQRHRRGQGESGRATLLVRAEQVQPAAAASRCSSPRRS